jgi:hypothetical protein
MFCSTRSKILQMLIGRMARNPGHAELFTGTLARAGEQGMISLIEHADGGSMIMKCLDTFSAYQIRVRAKPIYFKSPTSSIYI